MPRKPRFQLPGYPQHIIQRGNNRQPCFFACSRYIELNPVRAGMVEHPGEYRWSSYQANAQGAADKLIRYHAEYLALGSDPDDRATNYRELFLHQLETDLVDEMRKALNHELVAGSSRFKNEIEAATKRRVSLGEPGRPRKDKDSRLY